MSVHRQYEVHEDCIGLYSTNETNADQLTCLIKDVLIRSNLPLYNCRGQCYDGAANMSGRRTGVATKIQQVEPTAVYLHCMSHSLNLAVQDTCCSITIMRDAFDTVLELSKLFSTLQRKNQCFLSSNQSFLLSLLVSSHSVPLVGQYGPSHFGLSY